MNKKQKDAIFVYGWLAWPILHFIVFWICMNIGTVADSFYDFGKLGGGKEFAWFENYVEVIEYLFGVKKTTANLLNTHTILNTFSLIPLSLLINLPLTIFFSYCIYKKIMFHKAFEIILFVPAIISATVLCLIFKMALDPSTGLFSEFLRMIGAGKAIPNQGFLGDDSTMWGAILVFSIWTGVNGNLIYFQSAIARLPDSVFESSELDGASEVRQFFSMALPLVWPTITTMSITLVGGVFGWLMPSMLLTNSAPRASTLGLYIMQTIKQGGSKTSGLVCALGVLVGVFGAAFILAFKTLMEKLTTEVEY